MTHKITQCPKCATAFRVTDAQLAVAKGAVRCGACLHIFNANDHWRVPAAAAQPEPVTASAPASADALLDNRPKAPSEPSLDFESPQNGTEQTDEPSFEDEGEDEERFDDGKDEPKFEVLQEDIVTSELATEDERDLDEDFLIDDQHDGEQDDEDDALIVDTDSRPLITSNVYADDDFDLDQDDDTPRQDDTDEMLGLDDLSDELSSTMFKDLDDISPETRDGADEQWARILLEELDEEPPPPPAKPAPKPDPLLADVPEIDADDEAPLFENHRDEEEAWEPAAIEALMAGDRIGDERRRTALAIEPEPLELVLGAQRRQRWRNGLELSGCVLALLLLAWQVVYFNFDRWSRGPERNTLASVCAVFGCELSSPIALNEIRTSNLIVRSHPQQRGALVVDAVITNTASYAQPYPNLLLQFSDINGSPVAGRVFSAEQYLAGELSGAKAMPSRQPVHISLAILDPGEAATNYHLELALPN